MTHECKHEAAGEERPVRTHRSRVLAPAATARVAAGWRKPVEAQPFHPDCPGRR